jgi:hypothetical protein
MDSSRKYLAWVGKTEFEGKSLNGPSLIETLQSLSVEEATSTDTYEGYTAWGVALHVLYFKYKVAAALGADLPAYQYEESAWPAIPEQPSQDAYEAMIDDLKRFHHSGMTAFESVDAAKLAKPMPGWKVSIGEAFAWVVSHDTNHNTQIRNMGLPSLKQR